MKHGEGIGTDYAGQSKYFVGLDGGDLGADALFEHLCYTFDTGSLFAGERSSYACITKLVLFS